MLTATAFVCPSPMASADVRLGEVWTDKARYSPGDEVTVTAESSGSTDVTFSLVHLGEVVQNKTIRSSGNNNVTWTFKAPGKDFTGYMVHVDTARSSAQTAIDVSSDWTRFPRFGYLDNYAAGMSDAEQRSAVEKLSRRYHLNALQFYDWMWRHEKPVKRDSAGRVSASWTAWNDDVISARTVSGMISNAHRLNMAAMPYSMSYAAREGAPPGQAAAPLTSASTGAPWRISLRNAPGDVRTLQMMDPGNPAWQNYMVSRYKEQISLLGFDGTHLDQLGDNGRMNDSSGKEVDLPRGFASIVDMTRATTHKPVGLNAVDGFGGASLAGSGSDYLYTELWNRLGNFTQVQDYLNEQRKASGGKGAVVAAYMNSEDDTGPTLEAETASLAGGTAVSKNHSGYGGSGFVDSYGKTGDNVTFTFTAPEDRRYGLIPRWANGGQDTATRTLTVDGKRIGKINLYRTDGWDSWRSASGTSIHLTAGEHKLSLSVEDDDRGYANLDRIALGSFDTPSVQLADAAFAANGATHIEMGQGDQMLVNEYFPDDTKQMPNALRDWMKSYYDVVTGYENLFFGPSLQQLNNTVEVSGQPTSTDGRGGTIWTKAMRNQGVDVIHLINLKQDDGRWRNPTVEPTKLTNLPVKYYLNGAAAPSNVQIASPDRDGGRSRKLDVTTGRDGKGEFITFQVDELRAWDFIYFGKPTVGSGNVITRSTKCLDVAGGNFSNGNPLQLWDCNSAPAMQWKYRQEKLETGNRLCLELKDGGVADGTPAELRTCKDSPSQRWIRTPQSQYYNPQSRKCLDVVGGYAANGTKVHLWECHTGASQKWTLPQG